jgi:hypothetical protein
MLVPIYLKSSNIVYLDILTKHFIVISTCKNILYCNCIYSRLPEDEPSAPKHVEDIRSLKIKILI